MEIKVEITEEDHTAFYKDYGYKKDWIQRFLILVLIDFVVSAFKVFSSIYSVNVLIIGIMLFPFFFVVPYLVAEARFRRAYEYDFYPESTKTYKPFA